MGQVIKWDTFESNNGKKNTLRGKCVLFIILQINSTSNNEWDISRKKMNKLFYQNIFVNKF